jgi:predicted nucleotidyltransferase
MLNFKKNQLEVLRLLLSHPERGFFFSEIGEAIGKHPGVFQRGIDALERDGIVVSHRRGNQRVFQINAAYPILPELKSIIEKTIGVETLLRNVSILHDEIITALIFGSYARNAQRPESDIDLLLVVTDSEFEDALLGELASIEKKIQRPINYKLYTEIDYKSRRKRRDPFLGEVLGHEYILLKGGI